jgi:hypothetical protein
MVGQRCGQLFKFMLQCCSKITLGLALGLSRILAESEEGGMLFGRGFRETYEKIGLSVCMWYPIAPDPNVGHGEVQVWS